MLHGYPESAFWRTFKILARQKGLSPSIAAEEAGIHRSSITNWRKGALPHTKTLDRLTAYFGVTEEYLLTGVEAQEAHPQAQLEETGSNAVDGKTGIIIVTENNAGNPYVITADNHQEILDDRAGGRKFVPADGARVFFASQGGKPISPYEYHDFSSLLLFLRGTAKQSA